MVWLIAGVALYALALVFIWCIVAINPPDDESHLLAEWPEKEAWSDERDR